MPTDSKQLVLDFFARLDARDIAGAAALMAEDCVNHAAIPEAQGRAGFTTIQNKLLTAFPDFRHAVEDTLVDGDRVVVRTTVTGTQRGPLAMTRIPLEATNKPVRFEQIHIARVAGGKIVEHWMEMDSIALFRQLGLKVVPAA
jgi:predicted ester cyclase